MKSLNAREVEKIHDGPPTIPGQHTWGEEGGRGGGKREGGRRRGRDRKGG